MPLGADDEDFPRLDVADERRADQIHRARLGADDIRVAEASERERPEAVRVAHGDQAIARHHRERKRALHLRDGVDDGILDRGFFERA